VTPNDLGVLFETFERSAFRLEARDDYRVPEEEERLTAFLFGREVPPRTHDDEWLSLVSRATAAGRRIVRVRIVSRPFTDYTRFELAVYPENIGAGEEVRVLEREWLREMRDGWEEDFWLFDGGTAVVLRYDADGRFLGVEEGLNTERYLRIEREALERSVPFAHFQPRVPLIE
jgi:hypothetical protein